MSEDLNALEGGPSQPPGTRAKSKARPSAEIRALARAQTRTALKVLVGIMRNDEATPAVRLSAANAVLDRGWGRSTQPAESGDDVANEVVHRVERIIVRPDNAGGGGGPQA